MKVGFIGLGRMGGGMAANLLQAGYALTVYNRTPEKAQALVAQGARLAHSVRDACDADVVFTMLADDKALEAVTFGGDGLVQCLPAKAIHVSSSTIGVALAERLTAAHAGAEQGFVSAPVFGRPDAAKAGKLFVVAAGKAETIRHVLPLLDAIGQRIFVMSDTPKAANLIKLSGNFLLACVIESLGEAVALVSKGGIGRHQYIELLTSTLFGAPVYKTYGGLIAAEKYEPAGFAAPLGQKDIRLALAAAEDLRVPLPMGSLLRDRFLSLLAQGGERLDWSAMAMLAAKDAGLK